MKFIPNETKTDSSSSICLQRRGVQPDISDCSDKTVVDDLCAHLSEGFDGDYVV